MAKILRFDKTRKVSADKVLTLEVSRNGGDGEYSYRIVKGPLFTEELAKFAISQTLHDILEYTASPDEILEAMDLVLARMGFSEKEQEKEVSET